MKMHKSWTGMDLKSFATTHGYCPLCASYHDLHTYGQLIYCTLNDVELTGWDLNLYNKLATEPESVDINGYNSIKDRLIQRKLVRTLPLIIERRADLLQKIQMENQKQKVQVVEKIVEVPAPRQRPRKGDWNAIADYMGLP